jgi:SAM-dependent methyltransferase
MKFCPYSEFKQRLAREVETRPSVAWHVRGSERRIYTSVKRICKCLREGDKVVDLGCLPANIPLGLNAAGLISSVEYHGTFTEDESDPMYQVALSLGVRLHKVDLDPLFSLFPKVSVLPKQVPLPDKSVDMVIMTELLEHLVWPHSMLEEARRLLKPSGVVIGSTPNATNAGCLIKCILGKGTFEWYENSHLTSEKWMKHVRFYSRRDIADCFKAHGFRLISSEYVSFGNVYVGRTGIVNKLAKWMRSCAHVVPWWRENLLFVAQKI